MIIIKYIFIYQVNILIPTIKYLFLFQKNSIFEFNLWYIEFYSGTYFMIYVTNLITRKQKLKKKIFFFKDYNFFWLTKNHN